MPSLRTRILLPVAALLLAAAVWATAAVQRSAATTSAARVQVAHELQTAMLDQETGLRGYQLAGEEQFLDPYRQGQRDFRQAIETARADSAGDRALTTLVTRAEGLASDWGASAIRELARKRADRRHTPALADLEARKQLMDAYRATVGDLRAELSRHREARQRTAGLISAGVCALIFMVVAGLGTIVVTRRQRAATRARALEDAFRASQDEFVTTLQAVSSEEEANALVKRHLERVSPGREVTVLNHDDADNRLDVRTALTPDSPMTRRLTDAEPAACVAVRLGQGHEERAGAVALLECELCGRTGDTACSPLVVSGRVIGSVLARQETPFDGRDRRQIADTVSHAAPVIGHLRAVAVAETRAATDALTGLPNRRAIADTLNRMTAQAHRTGQPLSVLALDLDHFKQINDRFGHDQGDEVLATVATVLSATVRTSDFVGRLGGEEFVVFAPDTSGDGALVLAEKIRDAVARVEVPGLEDRVTVSIGYAVLPDDAADGDSVLRKADRALYVAKDNGRNRVEAFGLMPA